ncbi:MAG: hypothetical protein IKQ49_05150 [Eubacterium sp.]|nr:hypothetical protein [Eubacterium sp.]
MSNNKIIQAWSEIRPDTASDRRMLSNILEKNQEMNSAGALHRNKKWIPILAGSVVLLAAGLILAFSLGWFSERSYTFTLENGETIQYSRDGNGIFSSSFSFDFPTVERELTAEELSAFLPVLPGEINMLPAIFNKETGDFIYLEGHIGERHFIYAPKEFSINDAIVDSGNASVSVINGCSVRSGFFTTDKNSRGEQNTIFYATIDLKDAEVHVEVGGDKSEAEKTGKEISDIIYNIIQKGSGDFLALNYNSTPSEMEANEDTDSTSETKTDSDIAEGIHIPAITLPDPETAATADMIQLVVWQGNIYTYAGICYEPDIIKALQGDYLGEATGSIDEWSKPSDYEQYLAGTFSGKVYTVKGYDPSFRLSSVMNWKDENGAEHQMMYFLDHLNGITISKGSDFYEDRLKISGRVTALSWQSHQDWDKTDFNQLPDTLHQLDLDVYSALWRSFLSEIDQAPFIDLSTDSAFMENLYNESVQTHLFITLNDGTVTELRLFEGGYVGCPSLGKYFVRIPGSTFDEMYRTCTGK